jgi:hypothetical protein
MAIIIKQQHSSHRIMFCWRKKEADPIDDMAKGHTYFFDFLIVECAGYKNLTRRVMDAKRSVKITASYFILNRRCCGMERNEIMIMIICRALSRMSEHRWG